MRKKTYTRREFLRYALAATAGVSPLMGLLGSFTRLEAAQTAGEYRAIVCILLEGGADVFNMIAPSEADPYDAYRRTRSNIALSRESLLPLTHANTNGLNPLRYGMRENMRRMQELFGQKKLAVVANVGTLIRPVSLSDIKEGAPIPFELFAHNTQRAMWLMGDATGSSHTGWAARVADTFYDTPNPYFNISVADSYANTLQYGGKADALYFDDASIPSDTMKSYGFGPDAGGGDLGGVYQKLYEQKRKDPNKLMAAFATRHVEKLDLPEKLSGLFDNVVTFDGFGGGVHETGRALGRQLELVAQILSVRERFPGTPKRQIFFVNHHGWDTHDSDNAHQVGYLSDSLGAFADALEKLGLQNQVTTLTLSDFGRSLTSNSAGTDHGWGSHAFVMGGAVKGGDIYGKMPELRPDSPDAWEDRMIPTTSMEQYLATVLRWFGASEPELLKIFPNIGAFSGTDLGFMG